MKVELWLNSSLSSRSLIGYSTRGFILWHFTATPDGFTKTHASSVEPWKIFLWKQPQQEIFMLDTALVGRNGSFLSRREFKNHSRWGAVGAHSLHSEVAMHFSGPGLKSSVVWIFSDNFLYWKLDANYHFRKSLDIFFSVILVFSFTVKHNQHIFNIPCNQNKWRCMIKEGYYGQSTQHHLGIMQLITKTNCKNWQKLPKSLTGACFLIHLYLNLYFFLAQSF